MNADVPNGVLSYSAGTSDLDPFRYRLVKDAGGKLGSVLLKFPELKTVFSHQVIFINCYPAPLGIFSGFPVVDTYLRNVNVFRALHLAEKTGRYAVILGQPLYVANVLYQSLSALDRLPKQVCMFVGGYPMPRNAEKFVETVLASSDCSLSSFHAYGVAEIDFGILVGKRCKEDGLVHYKSVSDSVKPIVRSGNLIFQSEVQEFDTGDYATILNDEEFQIINSERRVAPHILEYLNTWTHDDWERRTGYLGMVDGKRQIQLREGVIPLCEGELTTHMYWEQFCTYWTEKPSWKADSN